MLRYRDVMVGKGSALHDAITNKQHLEAARIYWECEVEFQKHVQGTQWAKPLGVAQAELKAVMERIEEVRKNEELRAKGARTLK